MTDTTNHAEVIRNWMDHEGGCTHYNTDVPEPCDCGCAMALTALDALTRELEEQKALYQHDTQVLSCLGAEDHERANKAEATIAAQSARIATLEEALGVAKEAMAERRQYASDWERKYHEVWDEEDAKVSAALAPKDALLNVPRVIEPDIESKEARP